MRHNNIVFHDLLKLVPWSVFNKLVAAHGSDELVRAFDTRHQFIALLYAQFSGANSLRAIETAMASHRARFYHVGGKVPHRSTFADANRTRSPLVFSGLFQHMRAVGSHSGAALHRDRLRPRHFALTTPRALFRLLGRSGKLPVTSATEPAHIRPQALFHRRRVWNLRFAKSECVIRAARALLGGSLSQGWRGREKREQDREPEKAVHNDDPYPCVDVPAKRPPGRDRSYAATHDNQLSFIAEYSGQDEARPIPHWGVPGAIG